MYVCVEITFHTFLTSALAGSKEEVTLVNNKYTETKALIAQGRELSASCFNHFNTSRHIP